MGDWMNELGIGEMNGGLDGWMGNWMDEWGTGWMNGGLDGWMNKWSGEYRWINERHKKTWKEDRLSKHESVSF